MNLVNTDKVASIHINKDELVDMLKLPEGMSLLAAHATFDPPGIDLIVSSYDLEEVEPGTRAPQLAGGSWRRTIEWYRPRMTSDPMKKVTTWEWEQPRPRPLQTCPTCESSDPKKHPAMQFEGEVQPCHDQWHVPLPPEGANHESPGMLEGR